MIQNKKILITGASQGLGEQLAFLFAEKGAHLMLLARSEKRLLSIASEIKKRGGDAAIVVCDISNLSDVQRIVKKIIHTFGTPDVLINNAGIWSDNNLEQKKPIVRQKVFDTNAVGTIQITEALLPFLKEKNAGQIVNIISTSGIQDTLQADNKFWKAYGASKWALTGYTNALQSELQQTRIKVTGLFPGGIDTNLYANAGEKELVHQSWMMAPHAIAEIVMYILTRPEDVHIEKLVVTKKI